VPRASRPYDRLMLRRRRYFWLMGTCIGLIVVAWFVVRFFSVGAAIGMSLVAMCIPPVAAIVGNRSDSPPRQRRRRRF
jgi:hypothetical protein